MTIKVTVTAVHVPYGSTIGYGMGTDEEDRHVSFIGDWRPMAAIRDAIIEGENPVADVPTYAIQTIEEKP